MRNSVNDQRCVMDNAILGCRESGYVGVKTYAQDRNTPTVL